MDSVDNLRHVENFEGTGRWPAVARHPMAAAWLEHEDGTAAVERLLDQLRDTPTPAGPTPRELAPNFIPLTQLTTRH